nr:hypothetical protein [Clostridium sp. Marseille-P2415]
MKGLGISEEQLKELVLRILKELEKKEADGRQENRQKLYMVCSVSWDEAYEDFLKEMEQSVEYSIYPVIPASWQEQGYAAVLQKYKSCSGIVYRSLEKPEDLETAVTVFPAVPRDMLVKAALCISDTYETSWISDCIEMGSRIVFLRSGLKRFSGREQPAYTKQIMAYYRQVLEYGIEICGMRELSGREPYRPAPQTGNPENIPQLPLKTEHGKKRVITASNVDKFASDGVLSLQQGDIVTDMAKDRAKLLNIVLKET